MAPPSPPTDDTVEELMALEEDGVELRTPKRDEGTATEFSSQGGGGAAGSDSSTVSTPLLGGATQVATKKKKNKKNKGGGAAAAAAAADPPAAPAAAAASSSSAASVPAAAAAAAVSSSRPPVAPVATAASGSGSGGNGDKNAAATSMSASSSSSSVNRGGDTAAAARTSRSTPDYSGAGNHMTVNAKPPCGELLEEATARRVKEGSLSGSWIVPRLPPHSYISDLLTSAPVPAITPVDNRVSLTHAELRELICRVDDGEFKSWGVRQFGSRIGVAVPNGPELMAVLLAVMDRHTAVPINPATTPQEMHVELRSTGVVALVYQGGSENEEVMQKLCGKLGIIPLTIAPDKKRGGGFTLMGDPYRADGPGSFDAVSRGSAAGDWESGYDGATPRSAKAIGGESPDPLRTALVLHTSGSTGRKKVVPISTNQLVLGAVAIAASTGLTSKDVCLNFMPLFHVGGICRNLLAPLFAGGSTVAMPFFDVSDFWTVAVEKACTWYYGAPTMHLLVVNSAQNMDGGAPKTNIRFVANAAGPLLPSVAIRIREVFPGAAVLTSYGMTECMPITCPPPGYALERAGSSGQAICPEVAIVDDSGERVSNGRVAHIVVKGDIVTKGYENDPEATSNSFFPGGWFKTGDMGWMDADGYLYVTGR